MNIGAQDDESKLNTNLTQIKRVLISVSDKTGIVEFAQELNNLGVEIISTGGTAKKLSEANIPVIEISDFTGFPEMMDGRVKTLHPLVHAGILGLRDKHSDQAQEHNIKWIDLVVCNLYPFSGTIQKPDVTEEEAIENIDIGGPTMIRSAAKNVGWVGVIVNPADYTPLLQEIKDQQGLTLETRKKLAVKAFGHTAQYDTIIHNYFSSGLSSRVPTETGCSDLVGSEIATSPLGDPRNDSSQDKFPEDINITFKKDYELRYGENPHQKACVYKEPNNNDNNILNAEILQGKKLSYNNIGDADGALNMTKEFSEPCCVVVKHANPCGVATGNNINEVFLRAYNTDSLSAFGGIISLNRVCTKEIAEELDKVFAEIVMAPDYDPEALEIFKKKKNLRVLKLKKIEPRENKLEFKYVDGGILFQDVDTKIINQPDLSFVTKKLPTEEQLADMLFAWKVLKHIKSNGILIAKNNTTLGVGAGQVSRVDAVDLAIMKAEANKLNEQISGSVLASDAFFPFRDSIDKIAKTGIKAVIQPGGSIKDKDVIKACDEHGIAMVFTGNRCFKH
ncbi:bifunctional phosphoribosylaminoimidazolecarboxamide formyltransferase/IMP cyclohydrolase [Patescibacteria group bacterium]|nr:bifunctional phosphoribosylaminoimidazolecarboxamide formyltransferase/IMP cyclohydrolase [Patescibacteria group bacterium]